MNNKTYYIYHISKFVWKDGSVGKIGVSYKPKKRTKLQGYSDYEILEQHQCIYKVSDREIELQKQYGYKVDVTPYWKMMNRAKKSSLIQNGITVGNRNKQSGQIQSIGKLNTTPSYHLRKLTYDIAQSIRSEFKSNRITIKELANKFNVSNTAIVQILNNKTYTQA